jgi:aryl-alcohol dehydrogenase-like predicted oxidoreductase
MSTLRGWATLEGTLRYVERFRSSAAAGHFRNEQNLWLSSLGIGTYLGNADENTDTLYSHAVTRAVQRGINVVDSAANYRFQRSERSIGQALLRLIAEHGFMREEIVVCTKGGYLPFDGAPPRDVRGYIEDNFVRPGIATWDDFAGGSHCMTPRYLQSQIDQSLRNLQLDCIDVYYIHNPEAQLGFVTPDEFYSRLRLAFVMLEQNIAAGKIRSYGLATWNGFRVQEGLREHHPLSRVIEEARAAGGNSHGFRFIQLPFNLAMTEAFTLANETVSGKQMTLLEAAARLGVSVVASASILQGRISSGLPEALREGLGGLATDAQTALQFVRSTPGIAIALVGMSRVGHVDENSELIRVAPLKPKQFDNVFNA